jgi:Zn-dependent protease
MEELVSKLAIWALPVIFAITLHEAAHGYVARHFGDPTADLAGRISLNPLRHIDPVGTLIVPLATLLLGGFLFGWAKPVPVDFHRLRRPKQDMFWVAAAGPGANLVMATGWMLVYAIAFGGDGFFSAPLQYMSAAGVVVNLVLMLLNLLPLPPLDGGRIAVSLLPHRPAYFFSRLEPWGLPILILLLVTGVIGWILMPLMVMSVAALGGPLGVSAIQLLADANRY